MPAPKNNKNAAKADLASSFLHVRVRPRDKARWVKAAKEGNKKLPQWVTDTLNAASEEEKPWS